MRKRGFTLMELAVYLFLFLLAGVALYQLYTFGTAAQRNTLSSYLVSGDTETCVRWLRRDLQETTLVSLRSYPGPDGPAERPGCSFMSGRTLGEGEFQAIPGQGGSAWNKHVFYTLVPTSARTGELVRWERPLDAAEKDNVPRPSTLMPSSLGTNHRKVMLKQVLLPNTNVANLPGVPATDQFGGFRVQYVRRAGGEAGNETLSSINPTDNARIGDQFADNTRLVEVEMKILTQDNSRPNFYTVSFRVHPMYPKLR